MRIDGEVMLITGGSEGIGAACAAEFAAAGGSVSPPVRAAEGLQRASGAAPLITAGDIPLQCPRTYAICSHPGTYAS